ncbi:stage V sporulation T C-terminal domain-containing protein [Anaerostipes faecalis]|uniref:stage V sporulation T C-terminal domain-containing protein n=1 Tax=Anaerostipes faecalis TaxID=2738446 RepID=UPI001C1E4B9C|nr:stage V sporulation T C-terminal domain-containing protein [Anaerostipes faecalis]MDY2727200.1 stage V sporulation T C-terminal domain-containing protein [Anaerostipes faecalis]
MRATGIVRRIDDLGRIVIPKEIRKTMHIRESDPLEIFTERDGSIILKKYSPIGEMGIIAKQYADSIAASLPHTICICDQDSIIAAAGPNHKKLLGKILHEKAEEALHERKYLLAGQNDSEFIPLVSDFPEEFTGIALSTIIAEGDAIGLVCIISNEGPLTDQDLMITKIGASFLGRQMET